jgi:hypothetical protein
MAIQTVVDIYDQHIRELPTEQQLELLALIAQRLAERKAPAQEAKTHSIMELHGLGKEIWEGIDAQEYVDKLRDEWEERTW